MDTNILQEGDKRGALVIMRHLPPRPAPEPLNPVGVGIIGGCINQPQMVVQLGEHLPDKFGARRRMSAEVVRDDEGQEPACTRPDNGSPYLGAKDVRGAARGQATVKPALAPVDEPKAVDFVVGARGLDQALPAPALPTPHASEGGMERKLDLVLEIDIRPWEEAQQFCQIGWHFIEQVRLDQSSHGWRGWRASPSQDDLHPQAFPT